VMADSCFTAFIVGMAISAPVVGVFSFESYDKASLYDVAIQKCELELPRTQRCVISAIPEEKE